MYKIKVIKNILLFLSCVGIVLIFRIIPHPPNFTPVIALSLYLPIIFGLWSLPFCILGFAITDYFVGFHSLLIWTWGSLVLVGLISKFSKNIINRLTLAFLGSLIFFALSNLGVWLAGSYYEPNIEGLITCYIMAIPFFTNTLISTMIFSIFIEFFVFSKYFNFIPIIKKKHN
tara:strand:- start:45 stop:563 length:519 start_codon:yes stop_codon:yes gene_type:complete